MHTIERAVGAGAAPTPGSRPERQQPAVDATAVALEIAPHHPVWPARFRVESEVLRVALAPLAPVLEHVGSTAVPGLSARPIVDIALGVVEPAAVDAYEARLRNFGYQLMPAADGAATKHRVLRRIVHGVQTHQAHVVTAFGDAWHRLLLFRDMLRLDRDLAQRYEAIKRELAQQSRGQPQRYATGKADFIATVLGRAAFLPEPA